MLEEPRTIVEEIQYAKQYLEYNTRTLRKGISELLGTREPTPPPTPAELKAAQQAKEYFAEEDEEELDGFAELTEKALGAPEEPHMYKPNPRPGLLQRTAAQVKNAAAQTAASAAQTTKHYATEAALVVARDVMNKLPIDRLVEVRKELNERQDGAGNPENGEDIEETGGR